MVSSGPTRKKCLKGENAETSSVGVLPVSPQAINSRVYVNVNVGVCTNVQRMFILESSNMEYYDMYILEVGQQDRWFRGNTALFVTSGCHAYSSFDYFIVHSITPLFNEC